MSILQVRPNMRSSEPFNRLFPSRLIWLLALFTILAAPVVSSCLVAKDGDQGAPRGAPLRSLSQTAASGQTTGSVEVFTDMARGVGLDFVQFNGMSGEFYIVENLGGGGALFDYDNDGDLDVFLVQGRMLGKGKTLADASFPPSPDRALTDRLFRNDLGARPGGLRTLRFTDVTELSGIDAPGYGMGVAVGDINNDGWRDIYVNNFGANQLWENRGDGSFVDVTEQAGVGGESLSVSSAFFDFDRDGWLDLYVGNYVEFETEKNRVCYAPHGARDYCAPKTYDPQQDRLYRNRGDGTFEDVSEKAGISPEFGPALGVVVADFNGDAWPDIYVANDGTVNQLWVNQKDGTFRDEALLAGTAVNMAGVPEGSMGVDAADFDGDGDEDLFMTHILKETNTLYINDGEGWFEDRTVATGLGVPSKGYTSFGTAWFDFDNDGWLDLFVANGGVNVFLTLLEAADPYPLHQTNQLFANLGDGRFREVTREAGTAFELSEVSRGAAFGDVDNDGDTDVLLVNNNGRARLLINDIGNRSHWLGLQLLDKSQRDPLGARVGAYRDDRAPLWRRVRADGSYASANDPRILLGLGDAPDVRFVRVEWPDGLIEEWANLSIDQYNMLHQGGGKKVSAP